MAILNKIGYGEILFYTAEFKTKDDIKENLISEFKIHRSDNPRFFTKLKELIENIIPIIEKNIAQKIQSQPEDKQSLSSEKPDYSEYRFRGDSLGFPLMTIVASGRISLNRIKLINDCLLEIEKIISKSEFDEMNTANTIKLKWLGSKAQLYSVLRQLKNDHEMIGNSFDELAEFLLKNVTSFEKTKKGTVEKELKRERKLLKKRRISVDPNIGEQK